MKMKTEGVRKLWVKYKYVAAVMLIGVVLLLWPSGEKQAAVVSSNAWQEQETEKLRQELEEILSAMSGVWQTKVLLTLESNGEKHLAQDTKLSYSGLTAEPEDYSRHSETILVDGASGNEAVITRMTYPTYRGALIVCQGGGSAAVQLIVTQAVAGLTGLPADRITVAEWQ